MYQLTLLLCILVFTATLQAADTPLFSSSEAIKAPPFLYKILSDKDWQASQSSKELLLSPEDAAFIHLATEEQLGRIIDKYWSDVPNFIVLKLSTEKLKGQLRLEANPGGTTKYYHLYNGSIPLSSVLSSKKIAQK